MQLSFFIFGKGIGDSARAFSHVTGKRVTMAASAILLISELVGRDWLIQCRRVGSTELVAVVYLCA